AADVEKVRAVGEQVEPHHLLATGALEGRFRLEAAHRAGFHFVLAERVFDERAALRAAAAFDLDNIFHVAAYLLERFLQHFGRVRLAEQAVEPREVDIDYRHWGSPPEPTLNRQVHSRAILARSATSQDGWAIFSLIGIAAPFRARLDWCRR